MQDELSLQVVNVHVCFGIGVAAGFASTNMSILARSESVLIAVMLAVSEDFNIRGFGGVGSDTVTVGGTCTENRISKGFSFMLPRLSLHLM